MDAESAVSYAGTNLRNGTAGLYSDRQEFKKAAEKAATMLWRVCKIKKFEQPEIRMLRCH
jgi:hypothetical protein